MSKIKALSLFSGGLDSTLAMKIIKDQGIEVVAVNINTGFGSSKDKSEHMRYMCEQIGVELKIIDIQEEFLQDVLFSPKYGYGKNFNPCIDCHAKMFSVAKRVMENEGASFLISGEVLGQRPMSQNRDALQTVLNESDCDGLLVRPLSAKNLAPTIAEINGWIDREKLEAINGRNRERQMQLVVEYGLQDIETPGGGCLLTEEHFSKKIRDFVQYDDLHVKDIPVIKHGRHLRLPDGAKLVIGRDKDDNQYIINIENEKFIHIKTDGIVGPHSLLSADASQADRDLSAKIILTFCKTKADMSYGLLYENESVKASPFSSRAEANKFLL